MLWHILTMSFSPDAGDDDRRDLRDRLEGLTSTVDVIRTIQVGPLKGDDPDRCGLVVGVEDEEALRTYVDHPDHQAAAARLRELAAPGSIQVVDVLDWPDGT